jgi:two-component system, chemotaxis family, protein-glutamate methylesterase/glutaminase
LLLIGALLAQSIEHDSLLRSRVAFEVVAIAASWGGLRALSRVLAGLPKNFPAAIVLVQHVSPKGPGLLANILNRRTQLPVKTATVGDQVRVGMVYVASPNYHLLIDPDGMVALTQTEKIHFARPSADCLFESVAAYFKERAIAVILTGRGRDGATGIQAIKRWGGFTIAQDEATSEAFSMPNAAIQTQAIDLVLPLPHIAPTLVKLVKSGREEFCG